MKFDERKETPIMFTGGDPILLKEVVEEGDEAVLFQEGALVMAQISFCKGKEMLGIITWSGYDTDLHPEFTVGKEVHFYLENIFGIHKMGEKV